MAWFKGEKEYIHSQSNNESRETDTPYAHLFWDDIHPSAHAHEVIAEKFCLQIESAWPSLELATSGQGTQPLNCDSLVG